MKLIKSGFTDYFGAVVPIEILEFDNNKYVTVRKPDGAIEEIKAGYIWRDPAMTRRIPEVDWYIHGGGCRKNFHPRVRKTTYTVYFQHESWDGIPSKAKAVAFASHTAKRICELVHVSESRKSGSGSKFGFLTIDCTAEGFAVQYGGKNRARASAPKFLRGYGR